MIKRTPLYEKHIEMGAKLVEFSGWEMPLNYGSQLQEHHIVRRDAGMFDVSHMAISDLKGETVRDLLRLLLANNVDKLQIKGKAMYSCMLNSDGNILDDLIVYYLDEHWFRIVSNAATREKDLAWINNVAREIGKISITERTDLAMIAVQGPNAREKVFQALGDAVRELTADMKAFNAVTVGELFIATTGYTGEDGFEIILPAKSAAFTWQMLADAGIAPCGLGARDTLRLEAGMALYGSDMNETTNPLETGLAWTVAWEPQDRYFIGRDALEKIKANGLSKKLVGLILEDKGVLRRHHQLHCRSEGDGEVTSGGHAPTLNRSIALAQVPAEVKTGDLCTVNLRGKAARARVVKYPFVRHGQSCFG